MNIFHKWFKKKPYEPLIIHADPPRYQRVVFDDGSLGILDRVWEYEHNRQHGPNFVDLQDNKYRWVVTNNKVFSSCKTHDPQKIEKIMRNLEGTFYKVLEENT